jgi:hypothetical protein
MSLAWPSESPGLHSLQYYSISLAWTACIKTPEILVPRLISQLRQIDFDLVEWYFQRDKIVPDCWSEFLRWLYRHDRQSPWFPQIYDIGFSRDEMNRDEGGERRARRRVQVVDIYE